MAGFRVDVAEAAAAACRWRFDNAAADRAEAAQQGKLVTFGIVPTRPETGYGYVQARPGGESVVAVVAFVEKPDLETAQLYVEAGEHFWNSGIFLFSAKSYLHELSKFSPEIHKNMQKSIEKCIKNVGAPHEARLVHAPRSVPTGGSLQRRGTALGHQSAARVRSWIRASPQPPKW